MAKYIECEAALEIAMQYCPDDDGSCSKAGVDMREMLDEIEAIPAADVASVRHGRWRWELADNGWANHICSNCGYTKNTDIHVVMDYRYCPNCGARMDMVTDSNQVKDGDGE